MKTAFKDMVAVLEEQEVCRAVVELDLNQFRYEVQGNRLVLTFEGIRAPDCPQVLAGEVVEWCASRRINPEIMLDAMLDAAYKEQDMQLLREAMV